MALCSAGPAGGPRSNSSKEGQTGFVVAADTIATASAHVSRLNTISRSHCREACPEPFGLASYGDRIEGWLSQFALKP